MEEYIPKESIIKELKRRLGFVENRMLRNHGYSNEAIAAWDRDETLYNVYQGLISFTVNLPVIKR